MFREANVRGGDEGGAEVEAGERQAEADGGKHEREERRLCG